MAARLEHQRPTEVIVSLQRFPPLVEQGRALETRIAGRDDPHRFRVTITFDSQSDGKTVLTMRQLHPTRAQRDAGIGFGAVELGYTTLDKLAENLRR